ncbi:MAG: hypothetical protein KAH67_02350 [Flavobacteriaceae bacterium]|nr:hypothetical protein [Flavobacteriaceae bacterium]
MKDREILGKLTKQEKVDPIVKNKIPNTFVISIPSPLSSYFSRFTQVNRPNTILLIVKGDISFERILRATKNINAANKVNIEGAKSELTIGKRKYSGIRLKGVKDYTDIPKIQELYKNEGFELAKNVRIKQETDSMIRVNKFFNIKKISDDIYQSANEKDLYYFVIPKDLTWDQFRDVTFDIKNNINLSGYDVAKGIFYHNNGITEMVRIVKPNITLEMVKEVKEKYLDRLT